MGLLNLRLRYELQPPTQMGDHHMFDNVFVNPAAYQAFTKTRTWPDKTMLVLEQRRAQGKGSINQKGNYQGTSDGTSRYMSRTKRVFQVNGLSLGLATGARPPKMIPTSTDCYSCHAAHAAVDTTFVQFYPTLLPIATSKGPLSAAYLKENASTVKK